jgi:Transcriptional Coactivator p15 (PC4).
MDEGGETGGKRERDAGGGGGGGETAGRSPTLARMKKQRREGEASGEDAVTRVHRALEALGAEGGDARSIAGFLKIDKSAANKALYALRDRGEATADASSGGAPRWTVCGGGNEVGPVKTTETVRVKAEAPNEPETEAVENQVVALAPNKRVTVRKWNNATLVDIREYYQIGGEGPYKPGKKGISLSVEQWRALRAGLGGVAAAVEACQTCGAETTVCEISNKRRCSVGKFKGRVLVNIREYYEKDGQLLPGAKGAALSAEAAAILVANAEKIDERVREFGD